ncbi:MAG: trigger factor [Erysipelotrichaceae bacterium]|nr:trigger factor [Erysipelotrichaceae bacterium]
MKKVINYKAQKEEWEKAKEKAFKKLNTKHKIDGFRLGKAPRAIFERNFPGQIVMEAADILVDQEYRRIIMEDKILPILEPKIDIVKVTDDELEINFTFITEPEVTLGEYKNLNVKKEAVKVTKEEVQAKIDTLLKEYAELVVKETGKVEKGDIAVIDFEGFKEGVAFDGGKGENYSLEIGSNSFIPGFEDGIIGMEKGEEKDLTLTFPEDYGSEDLAGKEVVFKVKVNEIKIKKVPTLDKDFFEDLGMKNITNKEELEKEMKEEIKEEKQRKADQKYVDDLLEIATSNMKVEIDDEIVEAEAEAMYKDFMDRMSMQGINEELYLQYAATTKEDIISHMKEEALKRLKNSYLLSAIIKEEKIEATEEEALKEVTEMAQKYNMTEEDVKNSLGGIDAMIYDIKVRKALDLMKKEEK